MSPSDFDRDLRAIHEARTLTRAARSAQEKLETFSQEQIDVGNFIAISSQRFTNEH